MGEERTPPLRQLVHVVSGHPLGLDPVSYVGALLAEEVVAAIQAIHSGGTYFSSGVSNVLMGTCDPERTGPLTTREQDILLKLVEGLSNKEVARDLGISVRTVETHRRNIKRKLGITSTAGLIRYAIEHGLVPATEI